ncbi:MAG: hypothetical protein H7281_12510 [Bacteriovorax sp.]|nr:hypothetical protein [Bacteriovorax sp.]
MKSLIALASMLVTASAFATTAVYTDYAQVLGAIKLDNACITDSKVKSISPVTVCTKMESTTVGHGGEEGTHTEWSCVESESRDLAYSRTFDKSVCLKYAPVNEASSGECLKWGTTSVTMPATIKVRTETTHGEATTSKVTWFSFPACN